MDLKVRSDKISDCPLPHTHQSGIMRSFARGGPKDFWKISALLNRSLRSDDPECGSGNSEEIYKIASAPDPEPRHVGSSS